MKDKKLNILLLGKIDDQALHRLSSAHTVTIVEDKSQTCPAERLTTIDLIIVRSPHRVPQSLIASCPQLRWIIRAGSGTDNIDVNAAQQRSISIYVTPLSAPAVAELAFGLMLSVSRQIPQLQQSMHRGEWRKYEAMGQEITGKTIAIVGFGRIGRRIAAIANSFDMSILAIDPTPEKPEKQTTARSTSTTFISLEAALPRANILVLCCPLTPSTQALISTHQLNLLPAQAIVINVARGGVVNSDALYNALESGHLWGAGLDTYASEPPGISPLVMHPRVVTTPHIGAQTAETFTRIADEIERIIAFDILPQMQKPAHQPTTVTLSEVTP